ncbi:MAG: DUF1365 domain-containing protein [Planctomycetota bacterium]
MKSKIYYGTILHQRHTPIQHPFRYGIYFLALDLDELDSLSSKSAWFGYNQMKPFSIYDNDYLGKMPLSIKEKLIYWLKAYGISETPERVLLVTMPRLFGYTFNPVNFYYCYRSGDEIFCMVVEINNTFGEKHLYFLPTSASASPNSLKYRFTREKAFHVSPFNPRIGDYAFTFAPPGDTLSLQINVHREKKPFFTSGIFCQARTLTKKNLLQTLKEYPFSPWLSTLRIGYQAFKLYFFHKLEFFDQPEPANSWTIEREKPLFLQRLLTGDYLDWIHRHLKRH